MIFITVGTHEQPFSRLIRQMDRLLAEGIIQEETFMQHGYESKPPEHCQSAAMLSYADMVEKVRKARIVITHGGPASILMPLALGKPPIVVPRMARYGEHVDDHQVAFTKRLESQRKVLPVYDIESLGRTIAAYDDLVKTLIADDARSESRGMLVRNLKAYCAEIPSRERNRHA